MALIDPRTVILLAGVMSGCMAAILYALKRSYPPAIKGVGEWSASLLVVSVGGVLGFGLGTLPDAFSIFLPRVLLPLGLFWGYVGTQRFFGVTPRVGPWLALIAGVAVLMVVFTFVEPSYRARLVVSTALSACLFVAYGNFLRQQRPLTFAKGLTMGVVSMMAVVLVMRLLAAILWPAGHNVLDVSLHHLVYATSFAFCIVLLSVSMVLMAAERLHAEVAYLASHDSLTNALTRRHINEACEMELDRSLRHGRSMALMIMDLDHFKVINDTYGHQQGDQVLIDFVAKVNGFLRRSDQLGRFGGEEFLALLPETSMEEAVHVAERIRQACAVPRQEPGCTVTIGISTNHAADDTVDALIARADAAMYRAKTQGRNRVEVA